MAHETILVVDDEKEIRNLITIYLKNEGYKVLQAGETEKKDYVYWKKMKYI